MPSLKINNRLGRNIVLLRQSNDNIDYPMIFTSTYSRSHGYCANLRSRVVQEFLTQENIA